MSDNSSKIGIIVPCYNVAPYIEECLSSIQNQTYMNWSCFVVDDGSTDGTSAIIQKFASQDQRFKPLRKLNGGQSSARNFGLKALSEDTEVYDLVSFVDSDDVIKTDMLFKMVNLIKRTNTKCVSCAAYKFDNNQVINYEYKENIEIISQNEFVKLIFSQDRWHNNPCCGGFIWKALYKYETIKELFFMEDNSVVEDEFFLLQIAQQCPTIAVLHEALYGYRQRRGSLVHDNQFSYTLVKGRELCMPLAATISVDALQTVATAYLHILIPTFKKVGVVPKITYQINNKVLSTLVNEHKIRSKDSKLYKLFRDYPFISSIYLKIRGLVHKCG